MVPRSEYDAIVDCLAEREREVENLKDEARKDRHTGKW
jgi:hypothetical protein